MPLFRALALAVQHKTHVDTVLYLRKHYLARNKMKESLALMQQYGGQVMLVLLITFCCD